MESEKEHGRYYIGAYYITDWGMLGQIGFCMDMAISPAVFLAYPFKNIKHYFNRYRNSSRRGNLEILQMQIEEFPIINCPWTGTWKIYYVLSKTHWLRLVQRRWRAVLLAKRAFMRSPRSLYYREIHGRFPEIHGRFPENPHTLRGMLSGLVRKIS
jgi:hypothetical protein